MEDKNSENYSPERFNYYKTRVEKEFGKFPAVFQEFVDNEIVVDQGDDLIKNYRSTGYNFANLKDFPFLGNEPKIFYSNYIQRSTHFAELLAIMEAEGIITEDDISYGARATKVKGKWDDPEPKVGILIGKDGKDIETTEFVEGIIIFKPKSSSQVVEVAEFLEKRAAKRQDFPYIQGSWEVPDNRIKPVSLEVLLREINFRRAVANVFEFKNGSLMTLKQISKFEESGWKNYPILLSQKLYDYLSDDRVLP